MPVSPQEISRHCNPRSFERGRLIARKGGSILSPKVSYDYPDAVLSAFVASSGGWDDTYRTAVTLDEQEGTVVDYVCTCPAYREYAGMCKHCVALALSYADDPHGFAGFKDAELRSRLETTKGLADVLGRFEERQRAETSGKVDVLPELCCRFGAWSASFRLEGPDGTYVMKSISEFVGLMQRGETFSYGKRLSFAHVPENLTPRGRRIYHFLLRQLSTRGSASFGAYGTWGSALGRAGRSLDLSADDVVGLLDALGETDLSLETEGMGLPARGTYPIVDELTRLRTGLLRAVRGLSAGPAGIVGVPALLREPLRLHARGRLPLLGAAGIRRASAHAAAAGRAHAVRGRGRRP